MATHGIATQHKEGLSNGMLGFILFIASEVMFFGGLFAAYFIARADATEWPPENMLTAEQIARGVKLEVEFVLPFIATILLVLSSVTIQFGVWAIQRGDRTALIRWLIVTIVLGLVFLTAQMYDYSQLHFRAGDTVYGTTFYTLTGFHGAHVAGGVIFMGGYWRARWRASSRQRATKPSKPARTTGTSSMSSGSPCSPSCISLSSTAA